MPVIDGEKYACSSCIKGHRVSGCNHNDRELHHINPKGRPVKQCEHCRGARKSKSHHARCDCGDKKDKDKHKDKGDGKGESTAGSGALDLSDLRLAHDNRCQCHSGGKCLCGTKKEELTDESDTAHQSLHETRAKPKLVTMHSDSHITVFANGHHKPCHRNNNTAHVSGAPYKIPRPHTLHGHSDFAALSQDKNGSTASGVIDTPATRSMDTLSLSNSDFYAMFGSGQRSADSLPATTMPSSIEPIGFSDGFFANQASFFNNDSNSPPSAASETAPSQQWPWAAPTATPMNQAFPYGSLSTPPSQECLPILDDWSVPSAGFGPIWSAGDLPLDPMKFTDSLPQPISHSGESKLSGPGLTIASSVHSEMGDGNVFTTDLDIKAIQPTANESLFWEDSPVYRLNTSAPHNTNMMPAQIPMMSETSSPNFTVDFNKDAMAAPNALAMTSAGDFGETAAIAMPSNLEDTIAVDPWPVEQEPTAFPALDGFNLPYTSENWF